MCNGLELQVYLRVCLNFVFIKWNGMDWIDLAQDRGQWWRSFEHGDEPSGSLK
jgi:hypothetical protein